MAEGKGCQIQTKQDKRDFGSFQSSNVQELIELAEDKYCPPNIPISLPDFDCKIPFGSSMKNEHFFLDDSWTFLNHGAFGVSLKQALQIKQEWLIYIDRQPVRFMDREVLPLLVYVVRQLAQFIDSSPQDILLIPNASHGVSTVIQEVVCKLSPGDRILSLNLTYGSTKTLLKYMTEKYRVIIDEVVITFPLQDLNKDIVIKISDGIQSSTKLAVIDHIASNQGIILPVKEIIQVCHSKGVQVLVDGAHGLGMLPLSMREIQADYYVSNAHKWFCCPKGCGFLYISSKHHGSIRPLVISHGFGHGMTAEFLWTGLSDFTSYLCLLTVIQFWNHYTPQSIREYITSTAHEGAYYLCKKWDTELLSDPSHFGSMVLIRLPLQLKERTPKYSDAEIIQNILYHEYRIEVPIKVIQDKFYVRISAHVYNKTKDYHKLGEAIEEMTKEKRII